MNTAVCRTIAGFGLLCVGATLGSSRAFAVDTMADWTGQNTVAPEFAPDNNYGITSPTSVGGQVQSKVNFVGKFPTDVGQTINTHFVYLSDPTLAGPTLGFTSTLHMEGTVTFNSPTATEPNLFFGWYNSENTNHRIGLGISNLSTSQGGAASDRLRFDFGYALLPTGNNKFYFASDDGTDNQANNNSLIPNGTYSFQFDYIPALTGPGGSMSVTVGTGGAYFRTITPLENAPWDLDGSSFDRFGLLQRSTTNVSQLGFYDIAFSNFSYTGGTAAAVAIPGDFDADGFVDGDDLTIWKNNFGATSATSAVGDADGDTDVDGADFLVWQRNFTVSPVTSVPEPAAITLLATAAICGAVRRSLRYVVR